MSDEFKRFETCYDTDPPQLQDGDGYSIQESNHWLWQQIDKWIEYLNGFLEQFNQKVDKSEMPTVYKLDDTGDFTGTLCNKKTACQIPDEIDNNRDQIQYLVSQFSDGQTGLIIDGGFFEETGINRNYNGGVF